MPGNIKVSGTWKNSTPFVKVNGVWKKAKEGWIKVDGVWRQWWKSETPFSYTGALQTYIVPDGVTSLDVDMAGGSGGGASNTVPGGGRGGHRLQATITVTPGQTLYIAVGGGGIGAFTCSSGSDLYGPRAGGWPGGGSSGAPTWYTLGCFTTGGSGGGYSAIFSSNTMSQANAILVAGAGGGANKGSPASYNGQNGTISAGGARASSSDGHQFHTNGSALQGGSGDANSGSSIYPASGGGGGYFGGGGGGAGSFPNTLVCGSGGDGSSWTKSGTTNITNTNNYQAGNGYVKLMI